MNSYAGCSAATRKSLSNLLFSQHIICIKSKVGNQQVPDVQERW